MSLQEWDRIIQANAERAAEDRRKWNEANPPKVEFDEEDDGVTWTYGVFELPHGIFWGPKYKDGYRPEQLYRIPPTLVNLIKAGF